MESNRSKKKVTALIALAIGLLMIAFSGTYAWMDYTQHKSNEFYGNQPLKYEARLIEDFSPETDWSLSNPDVAKMVKVSNAGQASDGFSPVYVRMQLKEYMEIAQKNALRTDVRYILDTDGSFISFKSQAEAEAAFPGHTADNMTDFVTGETGWFVRAQPGDLNGQMGKFVVTGYAAGAPVPVIKGSARAADTTEHSQVVGTDAEGNPVIQMTSDECGYPVHLWPPNQQFDGSNGMDNDVRQYIQWNLNDPSIITMSQWKADNYAPTDKWVVDDTPGDTEGWVYWGQALMPDTHTDNFMNSLRLVKQPEGDFYYIVHVDMQAVSISEFNPNNPDRVDWGAAGDTFWNNDSGNNPPETAFSGGDGTSANPYIITTAAQLAGLAQKVNGGVQDAANGGYYADKYYKLGNDIDISGYGKSSTFNGGKGWIPIGNSDAAPFNGGFDGNNHIITGLYIDDGALDNAGLFGLIEGGGAVKNLGVVGAGIIGKQNVGGVAGQIVYSSLENCYVSGSVSGSGTFVGGVVGLVTGGNLSGCHSAGSVSGSYAGGVAGAFYNGGASGCYSTSNVGGGSDIGGVTGYITNGSLTDCYATGTVSGNLYVGGVVGSIGGGGSVKYCYATGAVSGADYAGGIVGYIQSGGLAQDCVALNPSVAVTSGASAGRVAGVNNGGTLANNMAFSGMLNSAGTTAWANIGPNNLDGADLSADTIIAADFWKTTSANWDAWGSAWTTAPGKLPGLLGQTVDMPGYIKSSTGVNPFSAGDGTAANPYIITTAAQLAGLADKVNNNASDTVNGGIYAEKYYMLGNDIDLSAYGKGAAFNGGSGWVPIGNSDTAQFKGGFDGNNHKITGLYIDNSVPQYVGLFGYLSGCTVQNLGVADADIMGAEYAGGLAGAVSGGSITNCYVTGTVSGNVVAGGVAGLMSGSSITNCYSEGTVGGGNDVGGVAGSFFGGVMTDCYSKSDVSGMNEVGGLIGYFANGSAANCYATGAVSGSDHVGGLAGVISNNASLTNCYAAGEVTGADYVGGLAGYIFSDGSVKNCAALNPSVTATAGSNAGRVAGVNNGDTLANNVAFSGMLNGAGTTAWANIGPNNLDGADLSADTIIAADFWKTASANWDAWGSAWTTAPGKLPGLLGQTVDMPDYILSAAGGSTFSAGDGTAANPYIITTAAQLAGLADKVNSNAPDTVNGGYYTDKYYMLGNDIDLSAYGKGAAFNGGKGWIPIGNDITPFNGCFDGNNNKITGLYINDSALTYAGLFGYLYNNSAVQNLGVSNADIAGKSRVGGVAGEAYNNSSITNCYVTGAVSGTDSRIGGVAGSMDAGSSITNCYSDGTVSGGSNVGGLVGAFLGSVMADCYSKSDVSSTGDYVGGLAGYIASGSVTNCYVTGAVTGGGNRAGGVAGMLSGGSLAGCYVTGTVSGVDIVGGLIGYFLDGSATNCYATGAVTGSGNYAGGLIGYIVGGSATDCYATGAVSGADYAGGVVGYIWTDNSVKNCAALNPSVVATAGSNAGRVAGILNNGTLVNNLAFSGMLNSAGTTAWANIGPNNLDGADLSADTIIAADFWKTTSANWDAWGTYWYAAPGYLPGLFGQTVDMPAYILSAAGGNLFSGGNGSSAHPYLISTAEQLKLLADAVNNGVIDASNGVRYAAEYYMLAADIDLSGMNWTPMGTPGSPFTGSFDGGGKAISGLSVSVPYSYVGLFGYFSGNTIQNLRLVDADVKGGSNVGGIVGNLYTGTITDCYVTGSVASTGGDYVGGIVGVVSGSGTVCNCYATCDVSGVSDVGGIAGGVTGSVYSCYATGAVSGTGDNIGGLAGHVSGSMFGSAALNPGVTGTGPDVGRVAGAAVAGSLSDNIAFSGMNLNGAAVSSGDGASVNGSDMSAAAIISDGTLGGLFGGSPWSAVSGYLPGLFGQTVDMPDYILSAAGGSPFSSGDGTAANPYIITTAEQLAGLADKVNGNAQDTVNGGFYADKYYTLGNDIDLSAYGKGTAFNGGKGWVPIGNNNNPFRGGFDGGNNKITGLYINDSALNNAGLFGYLYSGTLQNLGIEGADITGGYQIGGVAGVAFNNSSITNCYVTGAVSGTNIEIGGIVGLASWSSITNCYSEGSVSGYGYVGGVAGVAYYDGSLTNCYSKSDVRGISEIGGLIGYIASRSATNCYATGAVSGSGNNVGGLAGLIGISGSLADCYATGAVSGADYVGGVAGSIQGDSSVENCAALNPSVVATAGSDAGRVAGILYSSTLVNNLAFSGMLNGAGTTDWANVGANNLDGADLSADTIIAADFWKTTTANWDAWGTYWYAAPGYLPGLFGQTVDMPDYILSAAGGGTFSAGDGTSANPYIITTAAQLAGLADKVNNNTPDTVNGGYYTDKYYMLGNDIDLTAYGKGAVFNGGKGWVPIGNYNNTFKGGFDGNNHKITGLYIDDSALRYAGLFGYLSGCAVQNLGVADADITCSAYVGGVAGQTYDNSSITNCYVTGAVSGIDGTAGGVVGLVSGGSITNCYSEGSVSGSSFVGGVAGAVYYNGVMTNCYSGSDVSGMSEVGGLIGYIAGGSATNCYTTGAVNGGGIYTGGLAGLIGIGGGLADCYAMGSVSGADFVGGVAGDIWTDNSVKNCAALNPSVVATAGSNAGRVAGILNNGTLANNMAFSGMLNGAGTTVWANKGPNNLDGADLSADTIIAADFWKTTSANWDAWGTYWYAAPGYLPGLFGQTVDIPYYILSAAGGGTFSAGDGTADNPYIITTAAQLAGLADKVNNNTTAAQLARLADKVNANAQDTVNGGYYADKYYMLGNDIDLSAYGKDSAFNGGNGWIPIGNSDANTFRGGFDGNNHKITGLYIDDSALQYAGLFGDLSNSTVQNLGIENADITVAEYVGGVAGIVNGGSITNCYVTGAVSATDGMAGGIAGLMYGGSITNCYSEGSVSGSSFVGGVVSMFYTGVMTNCYSKSDINGTNDVGGLIGYTEGGSATDCYATGAVTGSSYVGGVAGAAYNNASLTNCYATGAVSGAVCVGGVAGLWLGSSVQNCAALNPSVAATAGHSIGRVVGTFDGNTLANNVAFSGMLDGAGTTAWANIGPNNLDGADLSADTIIAANFWKTTSSNWNAWGDAWTTAPGYLPGLFGQTVDMPDYILSAAGSSPFDAGDGTSASPYIISTAAQLAGLADKVNNNTQDTVNGGYYAEKYYTLGSDIDLSAYGKDSAFNGGKGWVPIGNSVNTFKGSFDGGNNEITGLYINDSALMYAGLFGCLSDSAVQNLGVADAEITGKTYVGGVAGMAYSGSSITNCYVIGAVSGAGDAIGGVAGLMSGSGSITNCYSEGSVSGSGYVGGVVGGFYNSSMTNCYSKSDVSGINEIGGLIGIITGGSAVNCYATGAVSGADFVGGVAGYIDSGGSLTDCYATGAVSGTDYVGGLAGYILQSDKSVKNCAALNPSVAATAGSHTGRVAGVNYGSTLANNMAFSGMLNGVGTTVWADKGADNLDGADLSADTIIAADFWKTTTANWDAWGTYWYAVPGYLPGLFGQTVDMPAYIQSAVHSHTFSGGVGTASDPYIIAMPGQLAWLAGAVNANADDTAGGGKFADKVYKLGNDIGLGDYAPWTPIGTPSAPFSGSFDGGGHTIYGLTISTTGDCAGLFGYVNGGVIQNLTLSAVNISGGGDVGGVAGHVAGAGSVTNCTVDGTVTGSGNDVGGVVGYTEGVVMYCHSMASVSGYDYVGGVVGCSANPSIDVPDPYTIAASDPLLTAPAPGGIAPVSGMAAPIAGPPAPSARGGISARFVVIRNYDVSYSDSTGAGTVTGHFCVGGVTGALDSPMESPNGMTSCYSTIPVDGMGFVGGVIGCVTRLSEVSNCYATGPVTGSGWGECVGGVAGYVSYYVFGGASPSGIVTNCYATGTVSGTVCIGGVVGEASMCTVSNCYATGAVNGTEIDVGGIVGGAYSLSLTNCAALSPSVVCGGAYSGYTRRVLGGIGTYTFPTQLTNNAAFSGMMLNGVTISSADASGNDGADMAAASIIADGTLGGRFTAPVWTVQNGSLPGLLGQTVDMPIYILTAAGNGPFSGGNGSGAGPYVIASALQLQWLADAVNNNKPDPDNGGNYADKSYKLANNINLGSLPVPPDSTNTGWTPIGTYSRPFKGSFDGGGNVIYNLSTHSTNGANMGLFGYISGGSVQNLGIVGADINGGSSAGGLTSYLYNGSVTNCYVTGTVSGTVYVGGLVGQYSLGSVTNCYADCAVSGDTYVGGLIGSASGVSVTDCFATGAVSGTNTLIGGLAGLVDYNSTVSQCYATGAISGKNYAGGITGQITGGSAIRYCAALNPSVTAQAYAGYIAAQIDPYAILSGNLVLYGMQVTNAAAIGVDEVNAYFSAVSPHTVVYGADRTLGLFTDSAWTCALEKLPGLFGRTVDMPAHILAAADAVLFSGGSGTSADPYVITSAGQLKALANAANSGGTDAVNGVGYAAECYSLGADIDMTGVDWTPIGTPGSPFTGIFDGGGNAVTGLTVSTTGNYVGLFGYVNNGVIQNLVIEDANISGGGYVGGVAGYVAGAGGSVTNCTVSGTISGSGDDVGGVVGYTECVMTNCQSMASVSGHDYVGGVVGCAATPGTVIPAAKAAAPALSGAAPASGTAAPISATAAPGVTGDTVAAGNPAAVGPPIAVDYYLISYCIFISTGTSANTVVGNNYVGGVVGAFNNPNGSGMTGCYSTDTVTGNDYVGGVVGYLTNGSMTSCYAAGAVNGRYDTGGVIGGYIPYSGSVTNCYATGTVTGYGEVGGVVGYAEGYYYYSAYSANANLSNCYATGAVISNGGTNGFYIGGVAGQANNFNISNCYATGAVTGGYGVGGAVGDTLSSNISNCYATGDVSGQRYYVGGVLGMSDTSSLKNCAALNPSVKSGAGYNGRVLGYNRSSSVLTNNVAYSGMTLDGATVSSTDAGSKDGADMAAASIISDGTLGGRFSATPWTAQNGRLPGLLGQTVDMPIYISMAAGVSPFSGGSGTSADPYVIASAGQLIALADAANGGGTDAANGVGYAAECYSLGADIDMTGVDWTPIGSPSGPFTGIFDGGGNAVTGLTVSTTGNYAGLFGYVSNGAIQNLVLDNANISGGGYVGGVAGYVAGAGGSVTNCTVSGTISGSGDDVGGVVGYTECVMTNCQSAASVSGHDYVGGVVGYAATPGAVIPAVNAAAPALSGAAPASGMIGPVLDAPSFTSGTVTAGYIILSTLPVMLAYCVSTNALTPTFTATVTGNDYVGGVAGIFDGPGGMANCYSTEPVTGRYNVGGVAGKFASGDMTGCYATGDIIGANTAGGVIGFLSSLGNVTSCYATGAVTSSFPYGTVSGGYVGCYFGGVAGAAISGGTSASGNLSNCYATGAVKGGFDVGGVVGYVSYYNVSNCYATGVIDAVGYGYYFGGVAGGTVGSNLTNCAALNPSVYTGVKDNLYMRRVAIESAVAGSTKLANNVAFSGMMLNDATISSTDASSGNGANMAASSIVADGTLGGRFTSPVWTAQNGKLPGLLGRTVDMPYYLSVAAGVSPFSGGGGTSANPYVIASAGQLKTLAGAVSSGGTDAVSGVDYAAECYTLGADVDMTGVDWTPIGTPGSPFTGIFDGGGNTITGLTVSTTDDYAGLFGYVNNGAIQNLVLDNASISGGGYVGGVAGYVGGAGGSVTNCTVSGAVTGSGNYVGGVAGYTECVMTNCQSTASVSGIDYVGGVAGVAASPGVVIPDPNSSASAPGGMVPASGAAAPSAMNYTAAAGADTVDIHFYLLSYCIARGMIRGNDYVGGVTGGLVGTSSSGGMTGCCATGDVKGYNYVGGAIGYIPTLNEVSSCYATCAVTCSDAFGGHISGAYVGGLAGAVSGGVAGSISGVMTNCYATGAVKVTGGYAVGGLAGTFGICNVSNCYATGAITSDYGYYFGGLAGVTQDCNLTYCAALNPSVVSGTTNVSYYGRVTGASYNSVNSTTYLSGNEAFSGMTVSGGVTVNTGIHSNKDGVNVTSAAIIADGTLGGRFKAPAWTVQNGRLPGLLGQTVTIPIHIMMQAPLS